MDKTFHLPATGFVRLPVVLFFIPVSESDWWNGVSSGIYPKPTKLGCNNGVTAWRAEDIHEYIRSKDPINGQNIF